MNSIYIYHHLGLGDHIIANGMVRTIAKNYEKTFVFCKPHNFKNVSFMFRDLPNLQIIQMNDMEVKSFMLLSPHNKYMIIGHNNFYEILNSPNNNLKIDEIFYYLANVPIENRWSKFFIKRDIEREKEVFYSLGLSDGEIYAFIHDDSEYKISKEIPNMKIIKPSKEISLFDFIYTIEHATEIHCINSSFFCVIDCLKIQNEKMYLHDYVKAKKGEDFIPILGSPWKILS